MCSRNFFILFGSQTGNSEDIANDLFLQCQTRGLPNVTCQTLNSIKGTNLKELNPVLVIVCSTTGNGDPPENADLWWRSVKLRSTAKDLFLDIPYTVLGLGDTNYDKFCHVGKSIDKRLQELGGKRFMPLTCADEATGLEEPVESWKTKVIPELFNFVSTPPPPPALEETPLGPSLLEFDLPPQPAMFRSMSCVQDSIPLGLTDFSALTRQLSLDHITCISPSPADLIRIRSESAYPLTLIDSTNPSPSVPPSTSRSSSEDLSHSFYSLENPYLAPVLSASWLTSTSPDLPTEDLYDSDSKQVILMTLGLEGFQSEYLPGDAFGVLCPNPPYLVRIAQDRLLAGFGEKYSSTKLVWDAINQQQFTIEDLLTHRIDLCSVPRKAAVLALASHCRNPSEEVSMKWLCTKGEMGKSLWTQFVENQRLCFGELLALFPSCCPPLDTLASAAGRLPPRFYSVASSQSLHPHSVDIAFSVVKYSCGVNTMGKQVRRRGVCTSYLDNILSPFLRPGVSSSSIPKIRIFPKPTITFRLPGSTSIPLILIGPGTGVAPFIGFLEHRSFVEEQSRRHGETTSSGCWRGGFDLDEIDLPPESDNVKSFLQTVPSAPIHLFFGCQGPHDYLFKDKLEKFLESKVLSGLEVAMSRVSEEKVYVTHKITERGEIIADLILNRSAQVYVCGDGVNMAKDVQRVIRDVLVAHGGLSEVNADEMLSDMKQRRRYLQDVWS